MRGARPPLRRVGVRLSSALVALVTVGGVGTGCTEEATPPTAEELLAELVGRELSAAEQDERLEVLAMLCQLDDAVLVALWDRLDNAQMGFQDIAFSTNCPERFTFYAETTGRFETQE